MSLHIPPVTTLDQGIPVALEGLLPDEEVSVSFEGLQFSARADQQGQAGFLLTPSGVGSAQVTVESESGPPVSLSVRVMP